jgi:DNA (cytosine-5)-methyltransferase 1
VVPVTGIVELLEIHPPKTYSRHVGQSEEETKHPLRLATRPDFELGEQALRVADLFCGCGGLTLGFAQAARDHGWATEIALAVDIDPAATAVYKTNFPKAEVETVGAEQLIDGQLANPLTPNEERLLASTGAIDALVGGPPCQGYSDLNNHTRRSDPRNLLYLIMARATEILRPSMVLIENVPAVRNDRRQIVQNVKHHLLQLGYQAADAVLNLSAIGVPQRRKRHILLACLPDWPSPNAILAHYSSQPVVSRDLAWAIGDLADRAGTSRFDRIPSASDENVARMTWLLRQGEYDLPNSLRPKCHQDEHSYKSMYGRLRWSEPAQTLTSGFGSIGQGRYMHPDQVRALTAHEAARIQSFPDYFDFSAAARSADLATMIGNAVPPFLGRSLFNSVFDRLLTGELGQGSFNDPRG